MTKLAKNSVSSKVNQFTFSFFGIEPKQTEDQWFNPEDVQINLNQSSPLANRHQMFTVNQGNNLFRCGDKIIVSTVQTIYRGNLVLVGFKDGRIEAFKFVNIILEDGAQEEIYVQRIPQYKDAQEPEPEEISYGDYDFMYRVVSIVKVLSVGFNDF